MSPLPPPTLLDRVRSIWADNSDSWDPPKREPVAGTTNAPSESYSQHLAAIWPQRKRSFAEKGAATLSAVATPAFGEYRESRTRATFGDTVAGAAKEVWNGVASVLNTANEASFRQEIGRGLNDLTGTDSYTSPKLPALPVNDSEKLGAAYVQLVGAATALLPPARAARAGAEPVVIARKTTAAPPLVDIARRTAVLSPPAGWTQRLKRESGPFVEVGGPTNSGYREVDLKDLGQEVHTSNIDRGVSSFDINDGRHLGIDPENRADLQLDATQMPFRDESLGAVFASALPDEIREATLMEARRTLRPGGHVVWQNGAPEDLETARRFGFEIAGQVPRPTDRRGKEVVDLLLRKPVAP